MPEGWLLNKDDNVFFHGECLVVFHVYGDGADSLVYRMTIVVASRFSSQSSVPPLRVLRAHFGFVGRKLPLNEAAVMTFHSPSARSWATGIVALPVTVPDTTSTSAVGLRDDARPRGRNGGKQSADGNPESKCVLLFFHGFLLVWIVAV